MKLSVSSYSFQQAIKAGKMTQFDTIAAAHEMGLGAIEFIDLTPVYGVKPTLEEQKEYAVKLRAEADRLGMDINAYTIGANLFCEGVAAKEEINRLRGQLDVAALLGAKVMRHDVCYRLGQTGNARSFDRMLPTLVENIRAVTAYGEKLGIRTCTENHGYIAQDSDRVERLVNAVAHDNYGLLVDMGNFACVDEDSALAVSRVAPYAFHVHAKDFIKHPFASKVAKGFQSRGCNYLEGCAVGEGDIPVEQCIAILRRAGYDGYVSIEYEGAGDCFEGIKKGIETLRSFGITE